jgi:soluble lytic murein transglycosylase-like protein
MTGMLFAYLLSAVSAMAANPTPQLIYYADAYADHYRVPRALVHAIIEQESSWQPEALSKKGAAGLMQLMPGTAKAYGVRNPYSVTDNLSGGVQYLANLLRRFNGEMRLAVAAYYCGSRPLDRRGLAYRNPDVVLYVEAVQRRYVLHLREDSIDRTSYRQEDSEIETDHDRSSFCTVDRSHEQPSAADEHCGGLRQ